jgi:hypothetical protein
VVHFALTIAYVTPVNPLRIELQPLLEATIGTFFAQNWRLFAPEPLTSNFALLVRPLSEPDFQTSVSEGLPSDGWYDLSTPLWARFQGNRLLGAYDRVMRPASNGVITYLTGGPSLGVWLDACRKGEDPACDFYQSQLAKARVRAGQLLARIASAFCKDVGGVDHHFTHVALRVRQTSAVPWSQRFGGRPKVDDIELGVYPVDRRVVATGLYQVNQPR